MLEVFKIYVGITNYLPSLNKEIHILSIDEASKLNKKLAYLWQLNVKVWWNPYRYLICMLQCTYPLPYNLLWKSLILCALLMAHAKFASKLMVSAAIDANFKHNIPSY